MGRPIPPEIRTRVAKLIAMFASEHDGEVVAAGRAVSRALASAGLDLHDLADAIRETEVALYRAVSRPEPTPQRYAKRTSTPSWESTESLCKLQEMLDVEGTIDWPIRVVAPHEWEFLRGLEDTLMMGIELTPKQAKWFDDIYARVECATEQKGG